MDNEGQKVHNKPKKTSTIVSIIVILVIVIAIIIAANSGHHGNDPSPTEVSGEDVGNQIGELAPDFTVKDYDGNEVKLSDFRGTPVFINFWATWCPFCVDELPLMAEFQIEHSGGYITLAVDRNESVGEAKNFSDRLGVTDALNFVIDDTDRIYDQYGGFSMPFSIFIDSQGVIQEIKHGPLTKSELEQKISKILPN